MLKIRKYIALGIVFLPLFLFRFIAANFVIEKGEEIYSYVPIEADVLVEVNTRNFIKEIAYQRVYEEEYFLRKVYPPSDDVSTEPKKQIETGIDYFDRVVVFRETWSTEKIWSLVISCTNKDKLKKFAEKNFPESKLYFTDESFVIIQLSPSQNQAAVTDHFTKLSKKEIKPITEKVDLHNLFPRDKEINCFFSPQVSNDKNQIIDGIVSLDFVGDEITINGEFNPVSDFTKNQTIAYALNEESAFSMRSSLNLFHSLYWFGNERIQNLPEYNQLAFDYDGVNMILLDDIKNVDFPFKSFPELQLRIDVNNPDVWASYVDTLGAQDNFKVDTTTNMLITDQQAYFKYNLTNTSFELMRKELNFQPESGDSVYVAIHLNAPDLLSKTKFSVDPNNPASGMEKKIIVGGAEFFMSQMTDLTVISHFDFLITLRNDKLVASGKAEMLEKGGQSMIECLFLGTGALMMLQEYM